MTDAKRAELKRLAEVAKDERGVTRPNTKLFALAANPAAVLDLLKEYEEDQGVIRVWRGRTERAEADNAEMQRVLRLVAFADRDSNEGHKAHSLAESTSDDDHPGVGLLERMKALEGTLATEEAERIRCRDGWAASSAENERLKAEVQRLKDVIDDYSTAAWEREEAREVDK